jgi:uncharacterized protein
MKGISLLIVLNFCFALAVYAQNVTGPPVIRVTGTAEVMVAPDQAVFNLDVTKLDKELSVAKRQNDESIARILELTRRFAIAPQDVKTDYISVNMKYESIREAKTKIYNEDGDEVGKRIFKGYEVSKTVIVRLSDISRFEEFFSEVLKSGISEVSSVKFETSKLRENKDKARDMAMKAAREKAAAMAASVNQTIGKALEITEGSTANKYIMGNANVTANTTSVGSTFSESVATFAPGAIKVEADSPCTKQLFGCKIYNSFASYQNKRRFYSMATFPLPARPTENYRTGGLSFGNDRGGLLHAACDLIAVPGTEIYAVEAGTVIYGPRSFFESGPHVWDVDDAGNKKSVCKPGGTCLWVYDLFVQHADFLVRYGEIALTRAPGIKPQAPVEEGQLIGYVGDQSIQKMLHFEMYSNTNDLSYPTVIGNMKYLNFTPKITYNRRKDLMDPTDYLDQCAVKA